MDLPHSTPQEAAVINYELMDFSDISSDLPEIMTTMSDNDIPDLVDNLDSEHLDNIQHDVWFAYTSYLTLPKNNQHRIVYIKHVMNIVYTIKTRC